MINRRSVQLDSLWTVPFPANVRRRIHSAARNGASSWEVAQLHHDLGRFYARGASAGPERRKPKLVGLHGQTIFHNPSRSNPATLQLGEPAYLAHELGVPVISNFRAADMAAGGQGAPLATIFHEWVFGEAGAHVCVNNLGGISNVTSIDWRKGRGVWPRIMAFDTGPANVLMDLAMRRFTDGRKTCDLFGRWASRGTVSEKLISGWLKHPFFRKPPPKSTGRELFGEPLYAQLMRDYSRSRISKFDLLATLTAFTAHSIRLNYQMHLPTVPDRIILSGGGAENPALVTAIRAEFEALDPTIRVIDCESRGWPAKSIEPAAFALLAWLRLNGKPGNLPSTTGARHAVLCGHITQPQVARWRPPPSGRSKRAGP
jgi:anhydro-N-acetylmuramic acid kinase